MPDYLHKSALGRRSKARAYRWLEKSAFLVLITAAGLVSFAVLAGVFMLFARTKSIGSFLFLLVISIWLAGKARVFRVKYRRFAGGYAQPPAEQVIEHARSQGRGFVLFLRGFEAERQSLTHTGRGILDQLGTREAEVHARPFEALLVSVINPHTPLVTLSDPQDPAPIAGAYRFDKIPADWRSFVCELMQDAFPIVLHLTDNTEGIKTELDLIKYSGYSKENVHGYPPKTVIVVSKNLAGRNTLEGQKIREVLSGYGHIVFERHGVRWSRKHERRFHARLRRCFGAVERMSPHGQHVLRTAMVEFPLCTPSWHNLLFKFIEGPALAGAVLSLIITIGLVSLIGPNSDKSLGFLTWVLIALGPAVILSVVKALLGLDFIIEWLKEWGWCGPR